MLKDNWWENTVNTNFKNPSFWIDSKIFNTIIPSRLIWAVWYTILKLRKRSLKKVCFYVFKTFFSCLNFSTSNTSWVPILPRNLILSIFSWERENSQSHYPLYRRIKKGMTPKEVQFAYLHSFPPGYSISLNNDKW